MGIAYGKDLVVRNKLLVFSVLLLGVLVTFYIINVDNFSNDRHVELVRINSSFIRGKDEKKGPKSYFQERKLPCTKDDPCDFILVADMDTKSAQEKNMYKSMFVEGSLYTTAKNEVNISFEPESFDCLSPYNEAGRGMELSELLAFNGSMYTFDDRTGIVYDVNKTLKKGYEVSAKYILTEGDGFSSSKGMKIEWATTKDDVMWIGSFGKEYTNPDGSIRNPWPLWVSAVDKYEVVHRRDWSEIYNKLRSISGSSFPGYMIHEAVLWSKHNRHWVIAPRRWSDLAYDEITDNVKGTNKLFTCNESFLTCTEMSVGSIRPRRGFSSIKFLPGSGDKLIVGLKSEEEDPILNSGVMKSYMQVFDLEGNVLLDDILVPVNAKFEGLEFYMTDLAGR